MKTNTYQLFAALHQVELRELKKAVRGFGGEIHFGMDYVGKDGSGTERPIICVNRSLGEGPEDVYINACRITDDGRLEILAATKAFDDPFVLRHDDIEFGHVSFITDLIPDKQEKDKENLIMETAVFMAWDMFCKIYDPDNGMGQFEVCHEIIRLARKFEDTRTWKVGDDDYDEGKYFYELDKFEKEYLEKKLS